MGASACHFHWNPALAESNPVDQALRDERIRTDQESSEFMVGNVGPTVAHTMLVPSTNSSPAPPT